MLLSEKQAQALCERVMSSVKAEDAVVSVGSRVYSHLRFAANAITTSGRQEDTTVSVTVWIDRKRGAAATNETDHGALRSVVEEAEELARLSPVDREYVPTLGRQQYRPTHGYVAATTEISPRS